MLLTKARPTLDALADRLRGWATSVPERARRFQQKRAALETEVRDASRSWIPWIGDEIVARFEDLVRGIGQIANGLTALIHEVEQVESEVRLLAQRRTEGGDPRLTAWLAQRCRQWSIALEALGTECDRPSDLHRDHTTMEGIRAAVHLHNEAVDQLVEAERVLTALGADPRARTLEHQLPALRERLYEGGATAEWLDDARSLIQPLKAAADRFQDPPLELRTVASILTELRGWSGALEEMREQVQELEERHHFFAADWDPVAVQGLVGDAQRLREQLTRRAAEVRSQKLGELEEQIADLFQACGRQPALEERLAGLKERPFDRHQTFRDWLSQHDRVYEFFSSTAHTQEGPLERRLEQVVTQLQQRLEQLGSRPSSDTVRDEIKGLAHDLRQLERITGVERILRGLRRSYDIQRRLEQLAQRAEHESQEVQRLQVELRTAHEALQSEARRVKVEVPDLTGQIEELFRGESELERSRQRAVALTAELEALQRQFVERCQEMLAAHLQNIRDTEDVVLRSGGTVRAAALELPGISPEASPRQAADAVAEARAVLQRLVQAARGLARKLELYRAQAQDELGKLRLDELSPGDRQTAEQLLRELQAGSWSRSRHLLQRLQTLAKLQEKCQLFFDRLQQEQTSGEERRDELRQRLELFREERLDTFCPELFQRVEGLFFGIPPQPRQWSAVHHQLDLACHLFARVEAQAHRLAAETLERSAETVRERLRRNVSPSFRTKAAKVLAELDALGHETPAPVTLRLKLDELRRSR